NQYDQVRSAQRVRSRASGLAQKTDPWRRRVAKRARPSWKKFLAGLTIPQMHVIELPGGWHGRSQPTKPPGAAEASLETSPKISEVLTSVTATVARSDLSMT